MLLQAVAHPDLCAHEWSPSEPDEDGYRVKRCVKCGEFE